MPMGIFDEFRALGFRQPRAMDYWMMNCCLLAFLFFGKGIEKLSVGTGHATAYEAARKAHRFYLPYLIADYRWRFPVNKRFALQVSLSLSFVQGMN